MKHFLNLVVFSLTVISSLAGENALTNDSPNAQKERLFQRFLAEMRKMDPSDFDLSSTNAEAQAAFRSVFESAIIDPSFGLKWDEVPGPTLVGSNALAAVNAFVRTNGWNMQTNDCIFDSSRKGDEVVKSSPIRGLPWTVIHQRDFPAVTHSNILYVLFGGFHHDGRGVAYNPQTNRFAPTIDCFKPIGQHWYVWAFDHEFPSSTPPPKVYEGEPAGNVKPVRK